MGIFTALFGLLLVIVSFAGYILNVIHLVNHVGFGLLEVIRIIGIFMPPLGAIMGFV